MNRFNWLKNKGFNPKHILDIGANAGEWSEQILSIFPSANVTMVEANPNCEQDLRTKFSNRDGKVKVHICLLGNETKKNIPFYLNPKNNKCTGCSMMRELTVHFKDADHILLDMHQLDDLITDKIDILKIDVHGAELLVLEGGQSILSRSDFVLLEVNVIQYNEGAPMLSEVISYMDKHGFQVFDCVEHHQHLGYLMQLDFIFINRKSKQFPTFILEGIEYKNIEEL